MQAQPTSPIIITIADPPSELQGLSDVLVGSIGLAGVLLLAAVVLAAVFAGGLFLWRARGGEGAAAPGDDLDIV